MANKSQILRFVHHSDISFIILGVLKLCCTNSVSLSHQQEDADVKIRDFDEEEGEGGDDDDDGGGGGGGGGDVVGETGMISGFAMG